MGHRVALKRGPTDRRLAYIPIVGEIVLDTDSNTIYVGDGITPGGLLLENCKKFTEKILENKINISDPFSEKPVITMDGWEELV
jgi:hypothetical protein